MGFWRAVEVLAMEEFTTKLNLIALNQRHETHTYRHTYTSANNPSTWSSRVRTGAGWSYINLSELVKDKKKYTYTHRHANTHTGVGTANVLPLKWQAGAGETLVYKARWTNREIVRHMEWWSIIDIQTFLQMRRYATLLWLSLSQQGQHF